MKIISIDGWEHHNTENSRTTYIYGDLKNNEYEFKYDFRVTLEHIKYENIDKRNITIWLDNPYLAKSIEPRKILTMLTTCIRKDGAWMIWDADNIEDISKPLLKEINEWRPFYGLRKAKI